MFKAMDSKCLRFVLMAEGMEPNKVDIHKSYSVFHVTSPHCLGGMGLHQLFSAHRANLALCVHCVHTAQAKAHILTQEYPSPV